MIDHVHRVTKWVRKDLDLRSYTDARELVEWLNREGPIETFVIEETGWVADGGYKMPKEHALYMKDLRAFRRHQKNTERAIDILKEINVIVAKGGTPGVKLLDELYRLIRPLQRIRWWFGVEKGRWFLDQRWRGHEDYGLFLVARLSRHGLDWVRRCWCGKWFLAYSSRNRFHSATCRAAFWGEQLKTPEGRDRRAKYMRKLRAVKKGRESKWRKQ